MCVYVYVRMQTDTQAAEWTESERIDCQLHTYIYHVDSHSFDWEKTEERTNTLNEEEEEEREINIHTFFVHLFNFPDEEKEEE